LDATEVCFDGVAQNSLGVFQEHAVRSVRNFDVCEEIPALVIEYVGGPERQEAYFHRMSKVRTD